MGLRSIANASIAFGLVRIPVRVHSAVEAGEAITFNLLHADCGARLRQQYVCTKDGLTVDRDRQVKGYEFTRGAFVTFTHDELEALAERSNRTIAIAEFVDGPTVPLEHVDRCYYLSPDQGADRAYRLLVATLASTGRAAIGQYAVRGKLHLIMLTAADGRLLMTQLHYAADVRPITDADAPEGEISADELRLAKRLSEQLRRSGRFDASRYHDSARDRLRAEIQAKIEGREIVAAPAPAEPAPTVDLLEALRASLAAVTGSPAPRRRRVGVTR
jgi:DNA end-binding protein Ku